MGPGDAVKIPPGHDAWVIGSEPCVLLDFAGGKFTVNSLGKGSNAITDHV